MSADLVRAQTTIVDALLTDDIAGKVVTLVVNPAGADWYEGADAAGHLIENGAALVLLRAVDDAAPQIETLDRTKMVEAGWIRLADLAIFRFGEIRGVTVCPLCGEPFSAASQRAEVFVRSLTDHYRAHEEESTDGES